MTKCKIFLALIFLFKIGFLKPNSLFLLNQTEKHSPKKAAIKSAILPGLGQYYNKKNWKIPVIYVGLGTASYFVYNNHKNYSEIQTELLVRAGKLNKNYNSKFNSKSTEVLKLERNFYRTNREYSIIALAAIYVLNIVDATVDGHFYKFDIDKPLTKNKNKANQYWTFNSQSNGLSLQFNF